MVLLALNDRLSAIFADSDSENCFYGFSLIPS